MIKRILLAGLLTLALGMPYMKAQDSYLPETNTNDAVQIQPVLNATSSTFNRTPNKFAIAPQVAYNGNKLGAGLRLSYDFTDALRFTLDGDYYFYRAKGAYKGRIADMNANLNFVFGNGDFHFYLITGVYLSYGYSLLLDAAYSGEEYDPEAGIGLNIGPCVEYQLNEQIRVFLEAPASLGVMSSFMPKLGCAFCF